MKPFDALSWTGRWPFAFCDAQTPATLESHLRGHGIRRALVSPLDAVFAPEPGPANRQLLRGTRGRGGLEPVPVVNPALANWRDELAACTTDRRVRAVRILPNYHGYRLQARVVSELLGELTSRGVRLVVQMRMIDERHEFHAMNLKPVPAEDLAGLLARHEETPVLASGLLRPDVMRLAPRHPQLLADLSFVEWHDTLRHLLTAVPARQLVFASHTPLFITAAATAKLETSTIRGARVAAIAAGNLERFLAAKVRHDRLASTLPRSQTWHLGQPPETTSSPMPDPPRWPAATAGISPHTASRTESRHFSRRLLDSQASDNQ